MALEGGTLTFQTCDMDMVYEFRESTSEDGY